MTYRYEPLMELAAAGCADSIDGGRETMVRIVEGKENNVNLVHESGVIVDRSLRVEWRVDKRTVIEELQDGLYTIADWHRLDLDGLARVAAVIEAVLMDARAVIKGKE